MNNEKQVIIKPDSISLAEQLNDVQKLGNALGVRCIKLEKANAELLEVLKQARRKLAVDGRIDLNNLIARIDKIISKHSGGGE